MPWPVTDWVPAELFLEHNGVKVFCTYKMDEMSSGASSEFFVLDEMKGEEDAFHVRKLSTWNGDWQKFSSFEEAVKETLRQAIDIGELKTPGEIPVEELYQEGRKDIVRGFLRQLFTSMHMEMPRNLNHITNRVLAYVDTVADSDYISAGDVAEGFRYWMENQPNDEEI